MKLKISLSGRLVYVKQNLVYRWNKNSSIHICGTSIPTNPIHTIQVCHFSIGPNGLTDHTGEGPMKLSSIPCYGPIKYTCQTDETKLSCGSLLSIPDYQINLLVSRFHHYGWVAF